MLDLDKQKIFNQIKELNVYANEDNYKNKTVNQMLKILSYIKQHPEKYTGKAQYKQITKNKSNNIKLPSEEDFIEKEEPIISSDYDTDESTENRTGQGLEYYNKIEEQYVLKGIQNGKTFDIAYNDKEQKLKEFEEEVVKSHKDIDTYIIEENKKLTEKYNINNLPKDVKDIKNMNQFFRDIIVLEDEKYWKEFLKDAYNCDRDILNPNETPLKRKRQMVQQYLNHKNKIEESKHKVEEVSRNELLVKAKKQTITRYNKSAGYRGFYIVDIDTTSVFTRNCLRVTCKVGNYWDTVEMNDILYWIQVEAEKNPNYQINTKGVTAAIMNSIDGMDIKVDCTCGDFIYRFAYMASKFGYKYGKPETRPAKITNPNDIGSMCKHLISMLSNKKWLQQVTGTFMDFICERIEDVNKFLKTKEGEELTLPNELARRYAKQGFYSKVFKDKLTDEGDTEVVDNETEEPKEEPTNVQGNNPSTNKVNNIDTDVEEGEDNE